MDLKRLKWLGISAVIVLFSSPFAAAEATEKILKIKELELAIDDNGDFELWLNVSLDRKKLPKPLQVNYFDSTWNISSEKGIHKLGKLN